jgi:hypothetical protein
MIEIQSFILAEKVIRHEDGVNFDGAFVGLHTVNVLPKSEGIEFCPEFIMILRREIADEADSVKVLFKLVDPDGKTVNKLSPEAFDLRFPVGNKFKVCTGEVRFRLPKTGDYYIEITLDGDSSYKHGSYHFQVTETSSV